MECSHQYNSKEYAIEIHPHGLGLFTAKDGGRPYLWSITQQITIADGHSILIFDVQADGSLMFRKAAAAPLFIAPTTSSP